jgi:hypothetical protein
MAVTLYLPRHAVLPGLPRVRPRMGRRNAPFSWARMTMSATTSPP